MTIWKPVLREGAAAARITWRWVCLAGCEVFTDEDHERTWNGSVASQLHIDLREWADMLLVAPLSANTLARLAAGVADNLLTSVARAWSFEHALVVAPARPAYPKPFRASVCVALHS